MVVLQRIDMGVSKLMAMMMGAAAFCGCAVTSAPPQAPGPPLRQLSVPTPVSIPNGTPVRIDPNHPAIVHWEYYPAESKRLNEQGSSMVKLTVGVEGSVQDVTLTISAGYERLDAACLKAFRSERFFGGDAGWQTDRFNHRVADQLETGGTLISRGG
jgi:TonB family protein